MAEAARDIKEQHLPSDVYGKCESALYRYPLRKARLAELMEQRKDIVYHIGGSDAGPVSAPPSDPTASRGAALASARDNEIRVLRKRIKQVDDVVATLSDEQRIIVELRYWQGRQIWEICHEQHISHSTYHRRRNEIMDKMAERLGLLAVRES